MDMVLREGLTMCVAGEREREREQCLHLHLSFMKKYIYMCVRRWQDQETFEDDDLITSWKTDQTSIHLSLPWGFNVDLSEKQTEQQSRIILTLILQFLAWPMPGAQQDALCLLYPLIYSHCFDLHTPFSEDRGEQEQWICNNNSKQRYRFLLQSQAHWQNWDLSIIYPRCCSLASTIEKSIRFYSRGETSHHYSAFQLSTTFIY